MEIAQALSLALICFMGAVVPGASLVVVLNSVMAAGPRHGLITAWSHALAVGLYALLTVVGLSVVLAAIPGLILYVQSVGAVFLLYMAVSLWRAPGFAYQASKKASGLQSAAKGFLVAFLNPKLAIFFLALFSQFVQPEASWVKRGSMAFIALAVDGLWYTAVVLSVTHSRLLVLLQSHSSFLNKLFAIVLLAIVVRLLLEILA